MGQLKGHSEVIPCLCFSPDGRLIASGSLDKTVKVWDAQNYTCVKTLEGHKGTVLGVCFSCNGKLVGSCGEDETVKIWDLESSVERLTFKGHKCYIYAVYISKCMNYAISASSDGTIIKWNINDGKICCSTELIYRNNITKMSISDNEKYLISSNFFNLEIFLLIYKV